MMNIQILLVSKAINMITTVSESNKYIRNYLDFFPAVLWIGTDLCELIWWKTSTDRLLKRDSFYICKDQKVIREWYLK